LAQGKLREVGAKAGQRPEVGKARNCTEDFGEEICKIRVSNIACQCELAYEGCNRIRRVELETSGVARRKTALYIIAAQNETAKNERLCKVVEVSTAQGDVLQGRIIIVPLCVDDLEYLGQEFGWKVGGGGPSHCFKVGPVARVSERDVPIPPTRNYYETQCTEPTIDVVREWKLLIALGAYRQQFQELKQSICQSDHKKCVKQIKGLCRFTERKGWVRR
jgi:hypothetical protein